MNNSSEKKVNAWLAVSLDAVPSIPFEQYYLSLPGERIKYQAIHENDWVLVLNKDSEAIAVGSVYRIRSTLDHTILYFDKYLAFDSPLSLVGTSISASSSHISRLQWTDFVENLPKLSSKTIADVPRIENQAYVRELLQLAVMDDLLGPANGPNELIIDMGVRDRYLVGKLAPRDEKKREMQNETIDCIEGLKGPLAGDEEEEPGDLEVHTGKHDPGAEFDTTTGKVEAESDSADEIDANSNQSLVPSSFGITFCVEGSASSVEIEARWGCYERVYDHEYTKTINKKIRDEKGNVTKTEEQEVKAKVWQRIPCGGIIKLDLEEGFIPHQAPDKEHSEVRVQGTIRGKNENGDRLVTLFLVNAQEELDENKDAAWIFQPELIIRASEDSVKKSIFRRRPVLKSAGYDEERESLEMIYREHVEFAVGHGVSVHSTTDTENVELASEIKTVVMPHSEVLVTETPGSRPEDRPVMREMFDKGYLDMQVLADMERKELTDVLFMLVSDYSEWIADQHNRIGTDINGYDKPAKQALERCNEIKKRLEEGIDVLTKSDIALKAFRFANRSMAKQRIHSLYSLARRRGDKRKLAEYEERKNRSWRPFQLAFLLLSIPSLADPMHKDRTQPLESYADLLWFPTGGGKTEAYLGVAAFTMVIRRLQGNLGDYDSSRGLAVIMRYTLRLLTLQQFQRGTALMCAMEVLRREAENEGDETLGKEPFTIGLWVGNKVTPGTTQESHKVIEDIRNPDKFSAGGSSPAQLTSCPWCGSEIAPGRDIDVNKASKRTSIYCGDKKGCCEFSKGKSSRQAHPGLPVVVIDEEIYHRPPSMMIATVDKFAMMAWRGQVRTLFGRSTTECPRHGLLWPDSDCTGNHQANRGLPRTEIRNIYRIRPPDLIIQDEFHLISGPLGTMVGLYETAVDELCTWKLEDKSIKPKVIASTATVRKAKEQVNNVFMRRVSIFPPHGLDVEDNFFSVQRSIDDIPGRRYLGVCSPGSSRPAMLIRVYTAFLTAGKALFDRFGQIADPYMTTVGYFNSLRELGGMKRLAEDDVQTRSYRVQMSLVDRPGLAQRSISNIRELTSRVSSQDIPKYLDQLEVKFKAEYDSEEGKFVTKWQEGEARAIDIVLATNMLSVGVDVNRLGLMAVNGQPKGTAEYIQATSRVGRTFPGLVCTVLTWARPRDLSHYETFEHYHGTFYKHVEAQSVTPFSPRALDRGLTGAMLSVMRLENNALNPNDGAGKLDRTDSDEVKDIINVIATRTLDVTTSANAKSLATGEMKSRIDEWVHESNKGGRILAYEKKGSQKATTFALIKSPGIKAWDDFTVPMSMREVEPGVRLIMSISHLPDGPVWKVKPVESNDADKNKTPAKKKSRKRVDAPKLLNLTDLLQQNLVGNTVDVAVSGGDKKHVFRFLSESDDLPESNSMVIVIHPELSQPDIEGKGVAYGKFSCTELQDVDSGVVSLNIRIRRPGATTSIKIERDGWEKLITIGVLLDA